MFDIMLDKHVYTKFRWASDYIKTNMVEPSDNNTIANIWNPSSKSNIYFTWDEIVIFLLYIDFA